MVAGDGSVKIYFDGACRPNPGPVSTGVFVAGRFHCKPDCGHGDSSDSEWLALIHALEIAQTLSAADICLLGDSAMVISHMRGMARRLPQRFHRYHATACRLLETFATCKIRHISRHQNLAGIALDRHLLGSNH